MVTGVSYRTVLRAAIEQLDYPAEGPYSTSFRDLRRLLSLFGVVTSRPTAFRGYHSLTAIAVLLINYDPPRRPGHWTVYERITDTHERVLDPGWWLKNPVRHSLARIRASHQVLVIS